jgi:IS5 family transposase
MSARFRESGRNSFWGDCVYDSAVPQTHFLRRLGELLDWQGFTVDLANYYKGGAEYGPVPYHPAVLLKMLLLSYLYNMSERDTEAYVSDSLAARCFLGLAVNEAAPDHSTLSVFRERILRKAGPDVFEGLFQRVVQSAKEKGIQFGRIQVVDATHSLAAVDVKRDDERQKEGKGRRDDDASWGSKGRRKVKTTDGKSAEVNKAFYGYKAHVSLNAENGMITAVVATTGRRTDGQQFANLVAKDEVVGMAGEVYAGDKGYDDGSNHSLLWSQGKQSALVLNRYRTEKKDGNKEIWLALKATPGYLEGKKERYKVEQKFGEGKHYHGWGRCRYIGLAKYACQSLLTAMALNLKRMVLLLTGSTLRGPAPLQARA